MRSLFPRLACSPGNVCYGSKLRVGITPESGRIMTPSHGAAPPMLPAVDRPTDRQATRRDFIRICTLAFGAGGLAMLGWPLIAQMNPAADVIDPRVTLDLTTVPPGHEDVLLLRRRRVIVRHRIPADIAAAEVDANVYLRDPQLDSARVQPGHPEWLVIDAGCTREGCTVIPNPTGTQGWAGGWACPCCGSRYDTSGRARVGPAPHNLAVPRYEFLSADTLRLL